MQHAIFLDIFSSSDKTKRGFLFQGMNVGIIITTIPAMEERTSSNTAEMSIIFIWIGLATITGGLLIGPLFARINGMLLVSICLVAMGIFEALAPTWRNVYAFQAMVALMAVFFAALISGQLLLFVSIILQIHVVKIHYINSN